jgi:hypothetical protein
LTSIVAGKEPGHMMREVISVVFLACNVVAPVIAGPMYEVSHHLPYLVGALLMLVALFASKRSAKTEEAWLPRP